MSRDRDPQLPSGRFTTHNVTLKYFYINHRDQRFFSIWNHHKCYFISVLSLVMVRETSVFIRTMVGLLLFNFTLSSHYLKIQNIQCFIMTMPLNMVLIMHTITRIFSCDITKLIILCWCTQTQRTNSWATEHCCDVAIISSNMKPVS